jgi:hypothetical protein
MSMKQMPDNQISAQMGINLIEEVVLAMKFLWHPAGAFDAGIDGRIELRDTRLGYPLNRHVGVQSKAWARFTAETDDSFEFLCDTADIDYWLRSRDRVILVCSHPETREAWFVCVTDWFADAERRAARRVFFNKISDRFDSSRSAALLHLAERDEPLIVRLPPAPPEDLVSNLLPIVHCSDRIWAAPALVDDHEEAQRRYAAVGGSRASDYLLRDKQLYALRNPGESPLGHLCDVGRARSFPASRWSSAEDPALRRYWTELLRRALLQQTKHLLRWQPLNHLFYFPAPDPLDSVFVEGPNGPRQVIKVDRYFDKRCDEERLKYVRHHAFRPAFQAVDGTWCLAVEPDYLFTYDGERRNYRGDEYLAGIKRLDRNVAVLGQLRLWEHLLTRPPSLLRQETPLLTFGQLLSLSVGIGIDDAAWRGADADDPEIPGQQEIAA